ncbi:hypothetical protein AMST5_01309 [freshwater sediment metagenome]|uniref:Peptidase S74 domain-containing protein n=1 Tax=freshwater sediment metagenome TaxID=556182 RepID=A0AA48M2C0_9ZZZZ
MSLFGGGGSSASSDPFAAFAAMQQAQAAQAQTQLGQDWLQFAKEQTAIGNERQTKLDALTEKVTTQQLESAKTANQWATEDRARYKSVFQPLQDKFIDKANNWDSADAQAKAASEVRADVMNNAAAQKAAGDRAMAARGINPASGAYAGVERAQATHTALGAAGAENTARNQLRTQAVGLQGDALNIGNGLPSQALDASRVGTATGSSAAGVAGNAEQNWRGNLGIMTSGFQAAGGLYNSAGNAWGNIYDNRVSLLNNQDEINMAGTNAIIGGLGGMAGLGIGAWMKSDENASRGSWSSRCAQENAGRGVEV